MTGGTHSIYAGFGFGEPSLSRSLAERRLPQAARDLPSDNPSPAPDLLPVSLPLLPQSRASRGFHWAALWRPHAPQRRRSAAPGDHRGQARGEGTASGFRRVVPRGCLPGAGASPARLEAGNPKARAAAKEAVGPGVAEEEECWQRAGLGTARGPVQNFRPWPGSQGPGAKPLPLPRVSSRVWPGLEVTWMLKPGPSSHAPSPARGPRAESTGPHRARPPLPLPELRPLLERSRLLAQRLPPGYLPSSGRLSPLRHIQETFISVSPVSTLLPLPSSLFFFS